MPQRGIPATVIPAKAGIHVSAINLLLDSRFRGNDGPPIPLAASRRPSMTKIGEVEKFHAALI
ncbi:MAG: hypothetical protein ACRD18_12375 [Terriglobia bacterium]